VEIGATNSLNSLSLAPKEAQNTATKTTPNAFGIGTANQKEVTLSPQAQILQQNERTQNERSTALGQTSVKDTDTQPISGNDYVRVSSSAGSAAKNNLTAEQAAEVYQSIQDLL
jgi:hypothetical protein